MFKAKDLKIPLITLIALFYRELNLLRQEQEEKASDWQPID